MTANHLIVCVRVLFDTIWDPFGANKTFGLFFFNFKCILLEFPKQIKTAPLRRSATATCDKHVFSLSEETMGFQVLLG